MLKVPVGTQIFDEDKETMIADLTKIGDRVVLAEGGNGGFGNAHFKSATNRAPRNANPGSRATSAGSGSASSSSPTPAWSVCRTPASPPSLPR